MEKHELIESAARLIAAKGRRLAAPGHFDAAQLARRQQRGRALLQIAAGLSPAQAQAAADTLGSEAATVTAEDRKAAANEVYSLLQRRSGADVVHLYDIALDLHYESYWAYLRGIELHENGDSDAACAALDSVTGTYEGSARHMAQQYRQQSAGVPDPFEEAAQQLYDRMVQDAGGEDALQKSFGDLWASVTGMPPPEDDGEDDGEDDEQDEESAPDEAELARSDLAAETAQCFAERLVDGDFAGARALLGASLQDLSAELLRQDYTEMIEAGRDGEDAVEDEEIEVLVMTSDTEMVDPDNDELASVYVCINGANFNEAISVTVVREQGQARIAGIEWGRP